MPKEISCGVVVFRQENNEVKYLLLHYIGGHWDFPKGHVEEGETEKETAIRETKEETGISDLELVTDFREKISYYFTYDGNQILKEVIFFVGETKSREIVLSDEHQGFDWLKFEDALEKLTFDNAKSILKKAKERIDKI